MKRKREAERELVLRRIHLLKEELARREREAKIADSIPKNTDTEQRISERSESNSMHPSEPVLTSVSGVTSTKHLTTTKDPSQPGASTGGKGPLSSEAKVPYWLQEEILAGMEKLEGDNYYAATSIIQEHFDGKIVSDSEIDIEELPPACVNKLVTYIRHTLNPQIKDKEECKDNDVESELIANGGKVLVDSKSAIVQGELEQREVEQIDKTVVPENNHETAQDGKYIKPNEEHEIPQNGNSTVPKDKPSEKVQEDPPTASALKISDEAACSQEIEIKKS